MLSKLQQLSLVSKVCAELDAHLGLSDKTLAEFIIHLAADNATPAAFSHALSQNGADFPESFAHNLLRIIQKLRPVKPRAAAPASAAGGGAQRPARDERDILFPGLALPNNAPGGAEGFARPTRTPKGEVPILGLGRQISEPKDNPSQRTSPLTHHSFLCQYLQFSSS